MLNTSPHDVEGSVAQALRIVEAGGELVRITVPSLNDAAPLAQIHALLRDAGCEVPLSADIHFTPDAAFRAASMVEKVRINPGNFVKNAEIEPLFSELLGICREHGTALRIGTNHGSLSARILDRYGNTPEGMVEATMEYLRICKAQGFNDVVVSLKSSDCRVMVSSVRLLVKSMEAEGMCYPVHLGVTEAGEGEAGRIRSAIGIGTLLNEGIGDTIRVSLTEAPENEIPVAKALVDICSENVRQTPSYQTFEPISKVRCSRPDVINPDDLEGKTVCVVSAPLSDEQLNRLSADPSTVVVVNPSACRYHLFRAVTDQIQELPNPIVIKSDERDELTLASQIGGLFLDRIPNGLWLSDENSAREILQSAGCRRFKTEFVSCPGCGRTRYDIQKVVARVKREFADFPHLKIAVMGCIVNGPGEMGDADYGYIGAGNGKVNLYKSGCLQMSGIPEEEAIDRLHSLISEQDKL